MARMLALSDSRLLGLINRLGDTCEIWHLRYACGEVDTAVASVSR